MNTHEIIADVFVAELQKLAEKKRGAAFRKVKSSLREKKNTIAGLISKYPIFEAVGSAALTTKGLHMLASGGMFGKALQRMSTGKGASKFGRLGLGIGTTYLGGKGIAGILNRL